MYRLSYAVISLLTVCAVAPADTLILTGGKRISGAVSTLDDETFLVQQGEKQTKVKANDVQEWVVGDVVPTEPAVVTGATNGEVTDQAGAPTGEVPAGATDATGASVNASVEKQVPDAAVTQRKVRRTERAVAFPVATDLLVTSASVAVGGEEPQLTTRDGEQVEFEVVRHDAQLALLRVKGKRLTPLRFAESFESAKINAGGEFRVCGYTEPGLFQPALTFIPAKADKPGKGSSWKVAADANPVSPGGPILCGDEVVGVQLTSDRAKPDAIPAITLDALRKFVGSDATKPTGQSDPAAASMQLTAIHEREQ